MDRDALEILQQNLRMAKQLALLAANDSGFTSVCQSNASIRLLSEIASSLFVELLADGSDSNTHSPSLGDLLTKIDPQNLKLQVIQNDLLDDCSWLYQLSDTQKSLSRIYRPEPKSTHGEIAVIASSSKVGAIRHWTQVVPDTLLIWCANLESVLDSATSMQDEY